MVIDNSETEAIYEMRNETAKQHYVQKALTRHWAQKGLVDVAKKTTKGIFRGKRKSPGGVFYERFFYEHVYGFSSAEKHLEEGMTVYTDDNHVFSMNDGEKYCGKIENAGFPVIQKIIREARCGSSRTNISPEDRENLCKYIVLQALRTPGGRRNFQLGYTPQIITEASSNEEALNAYMDNFLYLCLIGTYDEVGISDNYELGKSPFQYLLEIVQDMKIYILHDDGYRLVLGDNPCVFLGEGTGVSAVMMPLSPMELLIMRAEEGSNDTGYINYEKCTKDWIKFEQYCEVTTAVSRIVFNEKYVSVDELKPWVSSKCTIDYEMEIWSLSTMVRYLEKTDSEFSLTNYFTVE